jgi:hypothetical protein
LKVLIKQKSGLSEYEEIPEKLISSTFTEETAMLDNEGLLMLKRTYVGYYWHLWKNLLGFQKSMSQDSLAGSALSNRSINKDI